MNKKETIWFDITNTPQVHFLLAIYNNLKKKGNYNFTFSCREFSETAKLLSKKLDLPYQIIGSHYGGNKIKKVLGLALRVKDIFKSNIEYDISISCGSEAAIWKSKIYNKISIAFGDNDRAKQWTYGYFVDYALFPKAIPAEILHRQGLKKHKLYQYDGYKEDIYIADYNPDTNFLSSLPFSNYVVVRPENIKANYINNPNASVITPQLLKLLSEKGINILYLPRYQSDTLYAKGIKNIFIPTEPVNGLDACFYANAVLTGAGTFAREAACLGVPAVSFFAGDDLMAVDKQLIKDNRMFFSRQPNEIVDYLFKVNRTEPDIKRSIRVRDEVITKLSDVINLLIETKNKNL